MSLSVLLISYMVQQRYQPFVTVKGIMGDPEQAMRLLAARAAAKAKRGSAVAQPGPLSSPRPGGAFGGADVEGTPVGRSSLRRVRSGDGRRARLLGLGVSADARLTADAAPAVAAPGPVAPSRMFRFMFMSTNYNHLESAFLISSCMILILG
jgi:hypothetical protein